MSYLVRDQNGDLRTTNTNPNPIHTTYDKWGAWHHFPKGHFKNMLLGLIGKETIPVVWMEPLPWRKREEMLEKRRQEIAAYPAPHRKDRKG